MGSNTSKSTKIIQQHREYIYQFERINVRTSRCGFFSFAEGTQTIETETTLESCVQLVVFWWKTVRFIQVIHVDSE